MTFGKMGATTMMYHGILPAGARWVEYLESTGTQWINIHLDSIGRYRLDFEVSSFVNIGSVVAVVNSARGDYRGDSTGLIRELLSGSSQLFQANLDNWVNLSSSIFGRYIADMNSTASYFKMGTETITQSFSFINKDYVVLSAWNEVGERKAKSKYYRLEIWDTNGGPVRDFRPIAIGTTGYMLDLVSGEYLPYGNKGTGDFVIGPTISAPAIGGG